jgi:hypothetical protein
VATAVATAVGDTMVAARVATALGGAADVVEGGVGGATLGMGGWALWLTWWAWRGALPEMLCVMV